MPGILTLLLNMLSAWHTRTHPQNILCSAGTNPSLPNAKFSMAADLSWPHVRGLPCTYPCLGHAKCKFTWYTRQCSDT